MPICISERKHNRPGLLRLPGAVYECLLKHFASSLSRASMLPRLIHPTNAFRAAYLAVRAAFTFFTGLATDARPATGAPGLPLLRPSARFCQKIRIGLATKIDE